MKTYNGKIHVLLNGAPLVQSSLPQLFHGGGDYESHPAAALRPPDDQLNRVIRRQQQTVVESDDDNIDFALAKHFMQEEVKKKQRLQMKIKMFSERVVQ